MAYKSAKRGWYRLLNPNKYIPQLDKHMNSTRINENSLEIEYKSSLELKAIRFCDFNKHIVKWSSEMFHIKYIKPTDGKQHRYYVDLFIEFVDGSKFLVEIKSSSETKEPRKPSKKTVKAINNYQKALETWYTNNAKWDACKQFCKERGIKFLILTENELK